MKIFKFRGFKNLNWSCSSFRDG